MKKPGLLDPGLPTLISSAISSELTSCSFRTYGLQGFPFELDGLQLDELPGSCGAGLKLLVLPWVWVSVVVPTPAWLLPGPSNVVQLTVPCVLVQLSASGAAKATGALSATTKRAAAINKLMRLIKLYFLSIPHSPNGYETRVAMLGRMTICGGWAPCVYA